MDSKRVTGQIRTILRPALKQAGFTRFSGRNAWRISASRIDVVNMKSFNAHQASLKGCTNYSIEVNLGSYITAIPPQFNNEPSGEFLPKEYECQFRGSLWKSISQPEFDARRTLCEYVWYIDPAGAYLPAAVEDVKKAIIENGLPWFHQLDDLNEVLRILIEEDGVDYRFWGMGTKLSPSRHRMTGYVALALGNFDLAIEHLEQALASGCFPEARVRIRADLARAKQRIRGT